MTAFMEKWYFFYEISSVQPRKVGRQKNLKQAFVNTIIILTFYDWHQNYFVRQLIFAKALSWSYII